MDFTSYDDMSVWLTKKAATSLATLVEQLEGYIVYIVPVLAVIVLIFSLFNTYLLNLTGGSRRPSHVLYLNLLATGTLEFF